MHPNVQVKTSFIDVRAAKLSQRSTSQVVLGCSHNITKSALTGDDGALRSTVTL